MARTTPSVNAVVGLRERNKAKRRDAILDSTMSLLNEMPIADVTIDRIAAHAELAPATVYNLLGSREEIMTACMNRVLEGLVDRLLVIDINADPIAAASAVVEYSSAVFLEQNVAFRQIIGEITTVSLGGRRLSFDPGQLQIAAMKAAQKRGILRPDVNSTAVGRQIYLSFTGALHAWAAGRLSDDGMRAAVWHGLWSAVAAGASSEHRARFLRELRKSGAALAKAGYASS
jgi:AcrR family transcriptional regulator